MAPEVITRDEAVGTDSLSVPPELFLNRELSWLKFNERVLNEARDRSLPLLERVKFLAIFSSNLEEFFMIRVANVKRKVTAGITEPGLDGRPPQLLATLIREETQRLLDHRARLLRKEIIPALKSTNVDITHVSELNKTEYAAVRDLFEREIFPVLTPQAIDRGRRFPHVSNGSLNLLVQLEAEETGRRFARIKVPAVISRLVQVPREDDDGTIRLVWLEELIADEVARLFPGNRVEAVYPFHVNRDSDIDIDDIDDDAGDLINVMEQQLSQRTFGAITYLSVDHTMPPGVVEWLAQQLHASERDIYLVKGPLALAGLWDLASIDRPDLKHQPLVTRPLTVGGHTDDAAEPIEWSEGDVFATIRAGDVMLHHPYQSFAAVTHFLRAATRDPEVVAIKQTLYRLGKDSPIIPLLMEARDDDTQVAVLMEVKARFDEENNIALAHELETAGVHVNYGLPGLKTHCKALLVVRREPDGLRRYVHLSTGNYNSATARIYEDIGLFTAREDVCADVSELFNVLTGYSRQEVYRRLLVAPRDMRDCIIRMIEREIEHHAKSGHGRIIFKMNSLVDRGIITALYRASQAGVEIDLIVRGICCLRPGVKGWSETIRVRSIVGRFLEHSRVYYFRNGGNDEIYAGSADMMERNLDRRVEILFPIEDPKHMARLRDELLPAYLSDNVNTHILLADGSYQQVEQQPGATDALDVHRWLADFYRR
jgi:polyphosphate kinase